MEIKWLEQCSLFKWFSKYEANALKEELFNICSEL